MLIRNNEFEQIVKALDFEKNPELKSVVEDVIERAESKKKYFSEYLKSRRAENPNYGHSKKEIEIFKIRKEKKNDSNIEKTR